MKISHLILLILLSLIISTAFSQEMSDAEIEKQAQKDLAAFIQYSSQYRFSSDLQIGDKVVYSDNKSKEEYSLEVISKSESSYTVKELYNRNTIYLTMDSKTNEVQNFWGLDEFGKEQRPHLLSKKEVDTAIQEMTGVDREAVKEMFVIDNSKSSVNSRVGRMACSSININADFISKDLDSEAKQKIENQSKIYFSEDIPRLLPIQLMIPLINNCETLKEAKGGFVKNPSIEIKQYTKK